MRSTLTVLALSVVLFSLPLSAASIYNPCTTTALTPCTFNMSGIMTFTGTGITWVSDLPGQPANLFTLTGGQNVFSIIPSGSQEGIQNLNFATEPVGSSFGPDDFITFWNPPGNLLAGLQIDWIFPGIYSSATCGGAAFVGQQCSPAGTPFNFVNNPPGPPNGPQATMTFVLSGISADDAATWQTNFTVQFFQPFQTVLASSTFTGNYSATTKVVVNTSPVPEPTSLLLLGTGLIGLAGALRRKLYR